MTLATENVGNSRQMYIISCMNVPKQSQFVQKNEKLLLWCAQVTRWCGGWTSSFENVISDLRNAPKGLRKTVITEKCVLRYILVIDRTNLKKTESVTFIHSFTHSINQSIIQQGKF